MRRIPQARSALTLALALCFAQPFAVFASNAAAPTVILISMDGTRPADLRADRLPALLALAERGARVERLIPSLPSNTFPNHVTLVTGVSPSRHGIVDNSFFDPERGLFEKKDIPSWIALPPLWSILEEAGIVTASFHWVGSEGEWPGGAGPRYWKPFDKRTGEAEKVDQILAWLDLPASERPHFITSWFRGADHAGHHHGPESDEAAKALRRQSTQLQRLIDGIAARALWPTTTLIVVSDHGMMVPDVRIDLGKALKAAGLDARVFGIGGFVSIRVADDQADRAVAVAREQGLAAWRREQAPPDVPVQNPRFGPVVALAPRGAAVVYDGLVLTGFHGHRPDDPEMGAVLVAAGRGIVPGVQLPPVRNVDVAPTVLALFGLGPPSWMEGRPIAGLLIPDVEAGR